MIIDDLNSADLASAGALWDQVAPENLRELLGAQPDEHQEREK